MNYSKVVWKVVVDLWQSALAVVLSALVAYASNPATLDSALQHAGVSVSTALLLKAAIRGGWNWWKHR